MSSSSPSSSSSSHIRNEGGDSSSSSSDSVSSEKNAVDSVKLISADGEEFSVSQDVAFQCEVIRVMCEEKRFKEGILREMTFPEIRTPVLAIVVEYLEMKYKWEKENLPRACLPEFHIEDDLVLDVLVASNFLGLNE